jgi:hypothetical protein
MTAALEYEEDAVEVGSTAAVGVRVGVSGGLWVAGEFDEHAAAQTRSSSVHKALADLLGLPEPDLRYLLVTSGPPFCETLLVPCGQEKAGRKRRAGRAPVQPPRPDKHAQHG